MFKDSQRETIWRNKFGSSDSGIDAFGRRVYKANFEADHIIPLDANGANTVENGMPLHPDSNAEKSNLIRGTVNGKKFEVKRSSYRTDVGVLYVNGIKVSNGAY